MKNEVYLLEIPIQNVAKNCFALMISYVRVLNVEGEVKVSQSSYIYPCCLIPTKNHHYFENRVCLFFRFPV